MKLVDTNDVCEMLGISKSTLYRWCDVNDLGGLRTPSPINLDLTRAHSLTQAIDEMNNPDVVTDFPRPYKIGRSFKWELSEIKAWLETKKY